MICLICTPMPLDLWPWVHLLGKLLKTMIQQLHKCTLYMYIPNLQTLLRSVTFQFPLRQTAVLLVKR